MFKEFFYWSHYFLKKYVKGNTEPVESAYFAVCLVQYINILMILKIIEYFFTYKLSDISFFQITEKYTFKTYFIGFTLLLPFLIINYIYIYIEEKKEKRFLNTMIYLTIIEELKGKCIIGCI